MNALRSLKFSHRLAILVGIYTIGFLTYGLWSYRILNEIKVTGPLYEKISNNKDLISDILPPPEYIIESYLVSFQLLTTEDKVEQGKLIEYFKKLKEDYDTRHQFWGAVGLDSDIADVILKQSYEPAQAFYTTVFNEFIPAVQKQNKEAMAAAMQKMKVSYQSHRDAIDHLVDITNKRSDEVVAQSKVKIERSGIALLVVICISLGVGVTVAILVTRSVVRPLNEAIQVAQVVASGDLTGQITTQFKDEPGQLLLALKKMGDSLQHTIEQVRISTETIYSAAKDIAAGNIDLSSRTEAQSSSLEETVASMEELTSTVKHNSENAKLANKMAHTASEVAVRGGAEVTMVVETMSTINESARKIVDIISVIDGIAFQTNILALNAAVEAARAGEQGRGFAVVASEVRSLAQRSAGAAKEIKTLIGNSVENVEIGSKLVNQAGATMTEVVNSIRQVTDIMTEITAASSEQSQGIAQINRTVMEMDDVTQQNASLVEQSAAASTSLQNQAIHLNEVIKIFKLTGSAKSTSSPVPIACARLAAKPKHQSENKMSVHSMIATKSVGSKSKAAGVALDSDGNSGEWMEF